MVTSNRSDELLLAAIELSSSSPEAMLTLSQIVFVMDEVSTLHREAVLKRLDLWEQLIADDKNETKSKFRSMVEIRTTAWAAR